MKSLVVQGIALDTARLEWLRGWMRENSTWSRKRLAQALCVQWEWRNDSGQRKDFAARSFLLKLQAQGWNTSRYRGTCYQAANWPYAGHTTGRSRQDRAPTLQVPRKAVYLYRLRP